MSALLGCPFCGKAPKSEWQGCNTPGMEDCGYYGIDCCQAFSHADDEETAIAAWNRRAPGWQPIETAPRDGTWILGLPKVLGIEGAPDAEIVRWDDELWENWGGSHPEITRWQPLPTPTEPTP